MRFHRPPGDMAYRPDIDGLRAIAVIAVILGHGFEDWVPGGYLGVDVFFVISGFVITLSLLARDAGKLGSFLAAFSLRRIKRLLPALLVCVGLTCIVLLFLDATPETSLLTGAAALFGVSNFAMYMQALDYFSTSIRYNAFTHTWSLGVEEQFYLVFPLVFWFAFGRSRSRNGNRLLWTILLLSAVSLIGFLLLQSRAPMAAYYMMPLRFWELGIGVAAALALHQPKTRLSESAGRLSPVFLILLMFVVFVLPPGERSLGHVAVVGITTALLLGGASPARQTRLLTNRPMRYIGNISYSLYLWHWPFLTFGLLAPFSLWATPVLAISGAVLASVLSFHVIEHPIRHFKTPIPRRRHFSTALLSIFAVIAVVAVADRYRQSFGMTPVEAALRPEFLPLPGSGLPFNPTCVVDGQNRLLQPDTFDTCTFAPIPGGAGRTLWVMGDSHAGHLQGALLELREMYGYGVHLIETPGNTFPVINPEGFAPREVLFETAQDSWSRGDVIVLTRLYLSRSAPLDVLPDLSAWLDKVDALAAALEQEGIGLLLVGPPPMFSFEDIRACIPDDIQSCAVSRRDLKPVIDRVHHALAEVAGRHDNLNVLEIFQALCPEHAPICSPIREGAFMFRDRDHLNTAGAALLATHFHAALRDED